MARTRIVSAASWSAVMARRLPMAPKASADDMKAAWRAVELVDAFRPAHDDVLDPHAPPSGRVDPWFDREGHAWLERKPVSIDDVGMLVHLEPDPVAGSVDKALAVSGLRDDLPGGTVDRLRCRSRRHRRSRCCLRPLQHPKRLGNLRYWFPRMECASGIGAVAHVAAAEIDHDGLTGADDPVGCLMVRGCRVRSRCDNGKGREVMALLES